jgi:hypothetical protein
MLIESFMEGENEVGTFKKNGLKERGQESIRL